MSTSKEEDLPHTIAQEAPLSRWGKLKKTFAIYDKSVLFLMCFTYFLQGFRVFQSLAIKDLFKLYLALEPEYT